MSDLRGGLRARPCFEWQGSVTEAPSMVRKLLGARAYQRLKSTYGWVKHEAKSRSSLPLSRKLKMWRSGFFAESAALYDLPRNDSRDYLSDFTRAARCREINSHNEFFAHKLILRSFLLAMGFRQAKTHALLFEGRILSDPFSGSARYVEPEELLRQLAAAGGVHIVKPENGAGGVDVFLLEERAGQFVCRRGGDVTPFDLRKLLHDSSTGEGRTRMTLIEERLKQGPFWSNLFPESANTLRLMTLWTPDEPAPFIARAVQRIGTGDTIPTDNWSGGGISAPVNLVSGILGEGRVNPLKSSRGAGEQRLTHHPTSGAQIAGAVLPGWDRVQDTVLRAAASLPFNRIAGWDILVASDGVPVIIEANGDSDINVFQVHGGLLADPRTRRFYQEMGAIGRN